MSDTPQKCSPDSTGPVLTTADNPNEFPSDGARATPNTVHYGYCARCRTPTALVPRTDGMGRMGSVKGRFRVLRGQPSSCSHGEVTRSGECLRGRLAAIG